MQGGADGSHVLFSVEQMYAADAGAISAGVPGIQLMTAAGNAVATEVRRHYTPRETLVLCGPGNNGGDGFVAARILMEAGWPVRVALLGEHERLKGDAALAAKEWRGETVPLSPATIGTTALAIDALFGAGLTRPLESAALETLETLSAAKTPIVAIDVPSGVHGDTGEVLGFAAAAERTVTFAPKKTGHCLLPGRALCGVVSSADIGTPASVIDDIGATCWENGPALWQARYPWPTATGNKYTRGYAIVVSGGAETTGAARLAARAALRIGAGLVGVACPPDALPILAASQTAVMTKVVATPAELKEFATDRRRPAALIGPGSGVTEETSENTLALLSLGKRCVIDADALTVFSGDPAALFDALNDQCVLTPHDGEFGRVFPDITGSRLERARTAAARCGAVVLLKGGDTVVAAPDGRATITTNAPPTLATAGAGDVLAGMILGLLSQNMDAFDAANAAAWLHADAAQAFGPGLIAEDLIEELPDRLRRLNHLS